MIATVLRKLDLRYRLGGVAKFNHQAMMLCACASA